MPNLSQEHEKRLRNLIVKHDLSVAEDTILSHAVECAALVLGDAENYSTIGNSRYGGVPDLPPILHWPKTDDGYLAFLMQVNITELPMVSNNPLPAKGILYFFIEEDEACTEVVAKVLFYDGDISSLRPADPPPFEQLTLTAKESYADLHAHVIHPRLAIDLPSYGSPVFDQINKLAEVTDDGDGGDRYFNLIEDAIGITADISIVGQILGLSSQLNDDMRENAVLIQNNRSDKIYDYAYRKAHSEDLTQSASEWQLLWRIDSDFSVGVNIWDAGSFFVMIHQQNLMNSDFDNIYVEIETG
jgi:uncharacterized protein YwqG